MPSIALQAKCCVSDDVLERNRAHAMRLSLPLVRSAEAHGRALAILGGGPSIADHERVLRAWTGDIWAINGAYRWCAERNIPATFLTVDPTPYDMAPVMEGRALLADHCDPGLMDQWAGRAQVFSISPDAIVSGPTTATAAPCLAVMLGYGDVTFFGCESSFGEEEATHAYAKPDDELLNLNDWRMIVTCGQRQYFTCAEFLMQAEYLAAMIRAAPSNFREASGGLLRALVEHGVYDVIGVSTFMYERLAPMERQCG